MYCYRAATFAEGDGTMVNYEGRAQRHFQVYVPAIPAIKESWKWLWRLQQASKQTLNGHDPYPEELLEKLEMVLPQFNGISKVSPPHDFTIHGERIPRAPHRYSGRTAMQANINVSEPKPLSDEDSPLSFTMEGFKGIPPSSVTPFFWTPGWNSVQSVTKYQKEPGGSLRDGDPGVQLFTERTGTAPVFFKDMPEAFRVREQRWLVLPQYDVFGTGELSIYTKAIRELSPTPCVSISMNDAGKLSVQNDTMLKIKWEENEFVLPVKIKKELTDGIILVSAGMQGMAGVNWGEWVRMELVIAQQTTGT